MAIDKHSTVYHKLYGKGVVKNIKDNKMYISFDGKERIFLYPDSFEKGYLSTSACIRDSDDLDEPEEIKYTESSALRPDEIKHRIIVIKINRLFNESMGPDQLYGVVRGIWKASKEKAQTAEYAFGVYQGQIVAVYKPTEWFVCKEAKDKLPRKDIVLSERNEDRIFFVDRSYEQGMPPDENQKYYLGKSIVKLKSMNAQNPITYLDPYDYS